MIDLPEEAVMTTTYWKLLIKAAYCILSLRRLKHNNNVPFSS